MTWSAREVLMVLLERGVGVEEEGWGRGGGGCLVREEGREVGVRLFTPRLLIPLLKGFLFNNAGQFPEVGLTPPLFYKEMIFHTQTSPRMQLRCFARQKWHRFIFFLSFFCVCGCEVHPPPSSSNPPICFYSINSSFINFHAFFLVSTLTAVLQPWMPGRLLHLSVSRTHTHTPVLVVSWPRGFGGRHSAEGGTGPRRASPTGSVVKSTVRLVSGSVCCSVTWMHSGSRLQQTGQNKGTKKKKTNTNNYRGFFQCLLPNKKKSLFDPNSAFHLLSLPFLPCSLQEKRPSYHSGGLTV